MIEAITNIDSCAKICIDAIRANGIILICGNGGSAAMASHFAAELVVRFAKDRPALPCIALSADQAIITACANDFGYETVFARQVEAFGTFGDVLIVLSTSRTSPNVVKAAEVAKNRGLWVLAPPFTPSDTASHQEAHLAWIHELARRIEDAFA